VTIGPAKKWFLMAEEIRLLLRELVLLAGTDPSTIAPEDPPWTRASDTPERPVEPEPTAEEEDPIA